MSNSLEKSKRSALQGFHPRALQLAKVIATSVQSQNRQWPTDPLILQQEIQNRGVENIFDEALLHKEQYTRSWLQCIHLFRRFSPSQQSLYFLSIWHGQALQCGWNDIAEKIEQHLFSIGERRLLHFAPSQPKQYSSSMIEAHQSSLNQLLFGSTDLLLSGDWNGEVSLWDTRNNRQQWMIQFEAGIRSCAFSSEDHLLAIATMDGQITILSSNDGKQQENIQFSPQQLAHIAFSEDDHFLLIGGWNGQITFWNLQQRCIQEEMTVHHACISTLHCYRQGTELLIGFDDGLLQCWSVAEKRIKWQRQLTSVRLTISSYSLNEKLMAIGCYDGSIFILDFHSGDLIAHFTSHAKRVHSLYFHHTGQFLTSAAIDGEVSRWSIESGELWTTTISDESLKFNTIHPKGDLWASGYDSGDIRIWDLLHHQHGIPELARITALACSDNYKWLICGDVMGQIHIWHSNSQFHKSLPVFDAAIQSLAMTPTEELHVHLIDGSTYQWQQRSNISKHPAKYSFFSTRYQHWIFLSWNAQITTVTLHGEECYDHPREGFLSSFSHCEDLLFLGFSDGTILIWNWLLRCLQQELQPCKDEILALSYRSPRLCFSTSGGLLAMWNNSIEWQKTYSSQGTSVTFCDDHTVYACFANGQVHLIGQESHIPAIIPKRPTHSILLPGRKLVVATEQQLHFIAAAINPHHKS